MHRIKMIIEYDGSNYHGFQIQPNAHTIQAEIESSIEKLTGKPARIIAAGRTDSGVHALGQVIAFDTDSSIPPEKWQFALNSVLPVDIRIINSSLTRSDFHPRFDAISKNYIYKIYRQRSGSTFYRKYALLYYEDLDLGAMQTACKYFTGRHNFQAFCASGSSVKGYEREIINCQWKQELPFLTLEISANGFLYNMVRIIVGTMLEIGRHSYPPYTVQQMLNSGYRMEAGPTAPPQGLYLQKVVYGE
ncbi:MAG: tRNA pseudouridine(38-40) synthase TruA [Syntrophomonadaceae bacterium]|nr:tRNA pseudouridine(38-40) synthase TruA [Syntrophomonadaceae bacterium]